jgi:hypothetical protein
MIELWNKKWGNYNNGRTPILIISVKKKDGRGRKGKQKEEIRCLVHVYLIQMPEH